MKNKIMLMMCSALFTLSVLGFSYENQVPPGPNLPTQDRINEKATFDHHQALYNDKANTQIRAKNLVEKKTEKKCMTKPKGSS